MCSYRAGRRGTGLLENVFLRPVCPIFRISALVADHMGERFTSNSISSGHIHKFSDLIELENPARKRKEEMKSG